MLLLQADGWRLLALLAVPVFLVAVVLVATRWGVLAKLGLSLALLASLWAGHQRMLAWSGWPTAQVLPTDFLFLTAVFDEPVPKNQHPGGIVMFVHPMQDGVLSEMPRAFRLPYDKDLRATLEDGIKKARDGYTQLGRTQRRTDVGGWAAWRSPRAGDVRVVLRDVPRLQLPEK